MSRRRNWIEQTNPLRGLSPLTVVGRLEAGMRGELPQLMWLYHIIEQSDSDLMALVERRTSSIAEMDWNVVAQQEAAAPAAPTPPAVAKLRAAYDKVGNLQEAVVHLAMASFRGFAICQLQDAAGNPAAPGAAERIVCLPNWCFVRDGRAGMFKWNPDAMQTSFDALPGEPLDPMRDRLLIRTVERPIDRVALVKFVRSNFTQKAWADYIEKVAKDGVFIIEPPGVDDTKREQFKASAQDASDAGGGSLPNGTTVQFTNASRGLSPFEAHMRFLREQLVMAGTGGMLTMIASPTGIGQGASDAHTETFRSIARKEALEISEIFQRFFDRPFLDLTSPGEPHAACFELAYREETSAAALVDQGVKLSGMFDLDPEEWSRKTGLKLARKAIPAAPAPSGFALNSAANRAATTAKAAGREAHRVMAALADSAVAEIASATAADLAPLRERIDAIVAMDDPDAFYAAIEALRDELPDYLPDDPEAAKAIEDALAAALFNGIAQGAKAVSA